MGSGWVWVAGMHCPLGGAQGVGVGGGSRGMGGCRAVAVGGTRAPQGGTPPGGAFDRIGIAEKLPCTGIALV